MEVHSVAYSKIVIFATKHYQEMYQQLMEFGVPREKIMSWYFFSNEMDKVIQLHSKVSSGLLLTDMLDLFQGKKLYKILDIGMSLCNYGVLNMHDQRFHKIEHGPFFDSYSTQQVIGIGAAYNLYHHCYRKLGEVSANDYDVIVFLDAFLKIDLDKCRQLIRETFDLSEYILLNIPYGKKYFDWNEEAFSQFGEVEVFNYYDASFLMIKKECVQRKFCDIFVVTHKKYTFPVNDLYNAIQAGAEGGMCLGYLNDNVGDNISSLNPWINECTALYWMWKHATCEYIGLNHYRRYFLKDAEDYSLENILDEKAIREYLETYDIILAKAVQYYPTSSVGKVIREYVDKDAYKNGLNIIRTLLAERQPLYLNTFDEVLAGWSFYPCNMFVMKKAVMDVYCEWLFSFLIDAAKAMDIRPYDDYSKRIIGFFAERMLTVWLMHHKLKVKECQILLLDQG